MGGCAIPGKTRSEPHQRRSVRRALAVGSSGCACWMPALRVSCCNSAVPHRKLGVASRGALVLLMSTCNTTLGVRLGRADCSAHAPSPPSLHYDNSTCALTPNPHKAVQDTSVTACKQRYCCSPIGAARTCECFARGARLLPVARCRCKAHVL